MAPKICPKGFYLYEGPDQKFQDFREGESLESQGRFAEAAAAYKKAADVDHASACGRYAFLCEQGHAGGIMEKERMETAARYREKADLISKRFLGYDIKK